MDMIVLHIPLGYFLIQYPQLPLALLLHLDFLLLLLALPLPQDPLPTLEVFPLQRLVRDLLPLQGIRRLEDLHQPGLLRTIPMEVPILELL
jgi:hypothetical protein